MNPVTEPERKTETPCEAVVVGGGPAGIAAAWAASRQGRATVIVERDGAWFGRE